MKKTKNEKGITLVALVITIIILLILAGISISALTNTGIFQKAKDAKSASENAEKEQNKILDEYENELNKYIPTKQTAIDKTESKVGYYADLNGDGTVDGVIYADLAIGNTGSGQWTAENGNYTIPKEIDVSKLKDYYVSNEEYKDGKFGIKPVLTPVTGSMGSDRFYVMALNDINNNTYIWYKTAYNDGNGMMIDYKDTTSGDFGKGKVNTTAMISKWDSKNYGEQSSTDLWGQIKTEVKNGWFVPSRGEWSAFVEELGITTTNYETEKGLSGWYWCLLHKILQLPHIMQF